MKAVLFVRTATIKSQTEFIYMIDQYLSLTEPSKRRHKAFPFALCLLFLSTHMAHLFIYIS